MQTSPRARSIVGISRGCRAFSLPLACPFFLVRAENNGTPFRSSISIQFELAIDRAHGTDRCNFIDCPTDFSCYRVINRLNRSARIALEQLAFTRRINWVRHFALLLFFFLPWTGLSKFARSASIATLSFVLWNFEWTCIENISDISPCQYHACRDPTPTHNDKNVNWRVWKNPLLFLSKKNHHSIVSIDHSFVVLRTVVNSGKQRVFEYRYFLSLDPRRWTRRERAWNRLITRAAWNGSSEGPWAAIALAGWKNFAVERSFLASDLRARRMQSSFSRAERSNFVIDLKPISPRPEPTDTFSRKGEAKRSVSSSFRNEMYTYL